MQEMPDNRELPQSGAPLGPGVLDRALDLVRFLRAGCPWDAAQTPVSLTPYLLEESLELAEDIIEGAPDERLRSELGDLLLNVAFKENVALDIKIKALGGKYEHIKNIVQENSIEWHDRFVEKIETEELFGFSAEKIGEHMVSQFK